jgi:hypothetical protein
MTMTAEEHEAFRVEVLRERVDDASRREKEAMLDKHRALAELAGLRGDTAERDYQEAYIAAQTGGGDARFWAICNKRDALLVFAGKAALTDFSPHGRAGIAAEVERLRAQGAEVAAQP